MGTRDSKTEISCAEANLDVYVAGFMCSPWSPKGQNEGFAAEAAKTFFNILPTVIIMKPRAVILENVPQILQQADELIAALTTRKAYVFNVLKFQTADYGIPHHRLRVYIIMLRTDAVVHGTHTKHSQRLPGS